MQQAKLGYLLQGGMYAGCKDYQVERGPNVERNDPSRVRYIVEVNSIFEQLEKYDRMSKAMRREDRRQEY